MIFIFGSARSGSTWLGKIFDSHPDLFYLHEPDIPDRGSDLLPHWFNAAPTPQNISNAALYLRRLSASRNSRAVGIRPFFKKNYRGPAAEAARLALIYGLKMLERAGLSGLSERSDVPDLFSPGQPPQLVLKSVSSLGRAEVFLAADPSLIPVLLIRHPCGYVGSMLRGERMGVMTKPAGFGRLAATRSARRLGLNSAALEGADPATFLAWTWLISNAEAYSAIQRGNGIILNYEDLAADPVQHIRSLFVRLGLGWPSETNSFLARSQESDGDYYSVFRDPLETSTRWRNELDEATITKVRTIVGRDPIGSQYFRD